MYKRNHAKEEWIERCGITAGLPLFEGAKENPISESHFDRLSVTTMPDWIWSGNGIKASVFNDMKEKFAEDSLEYLNAIILLGGKATDHEVKDYFNDAEQWPLHIVSARRNYFCDPRFNIITSYPGKTVIGPKGKPNTVWFVNFKNLYKIIYQL